MWGALLAATSCGWLHHLTATRHDGRLVGHGVRGGQAMIATLRWRLVAVPARLIRHARGLTLRLPPGHGQGVGKSQMILSRWSGRRGSRA
jgi:hypothetical protein